MAAENVWTAESTSSLFAYGIEKARSSDFLHLRSRSRAHIERHEMSTDYVMMHQTLWAFLEWQQQQGAARHTQTQQERIPLS